jgi:hypothetical protein
MTIAISNLTIKNNVPPGTTIGVLTARDASAKWIPCNFTLTKNSAGFFAISGNNLVTVWSGSAPAGIYSVRVHAISTGVSFSANASFAITIST